MSNIKYLNVGKPGDQLNAPLVTDDLIVYPELTAKSHFKMTKYDHSGNLAGELEVKFDSIGGNNLRFWPSVNGFILYCENKQYFRICDVDGNIGDLACEANAQSVAAMLPSNTHIRSNANFWILADSGKAYLNVVALGDTEDDTKYLHHRLIPLKASIPNALTTTLRAIAAGKDWTVFVSDDAGSDPVNRGCLYSLHNDVLQRLPVEAYTAVNAVGGIEIVRSSSKGFISSYIPTGDLEDMSVGKESRIVEILKTDKTPVPNFIGTMPWTSNESKVFNPTLNLESGLYISTPEGHRKICKPTESMSYTVVTLDGVMCFMPTSM